MKNREITPYIVQILKKYEFSYDTKSKKDLRVLVATLDQKLGQIEKHRRELIINIQTFNKMRWWERIKFILQDRKI